jgi:hypothetical protein
MGSLASRPKTPDVTPVQYVYVPTTSSYTAAPSNPAAPTPSASDEEAKANARNQNLLERRRGTIGTVLTSFRGLLNDTVSGTRKALLGE